MKATHGKRKEEIVETNTHTKHNETTGGGGEAHMTDRYPARRKKPHDL